MSQKYFTTLTHIGAALHANAQLQQTTVAWTHLVLGDGNGAEPVPSPAQTGVIREVDRLPISSIEPDPDNPSWIVIEAVIPADRGGYVVRETALMGGANGASCIAVGNYPSATKPLLSEGAGSKLVIRVVVEIAHTATVTLKIDPAVVIASRDWVEKRHATQQKRGLVRLSTIQEALLGEADDIAVTPEGVMRVATALSTDSAMVVISATGVTNWEVPEVLRSGKKKALVSIYGAGGAGGGSKTSATAGGGGGQGGHARGVVSLKDVANVIATLGAPGAGVRGGNGGNGGATSFGSYATCYGGNGGKSGGSAGEGGAAVGEGFFTTTGQSGDHGFKPAGFELAGGKGGGGRFGPITSSASADGGSDPANVGSGGPGGVSTDSMGGSGGPARIIIQW